MVLNVILVISKIINLLVIDISGNIVIILFNVIVKFLCDKYWVGILLMVVNFVRIVNILNNVIVL